MTLQDTTGGNMPCTLQPWEIEYEERRENKEKFNRKLTDVELLEEVACQATRFLHENKLMDEAPEIVKKWFILHRKKDKAKGRG